MRKNSNKRKKPEEDEQGSHICSGRLDTFCEFKNLVTEMEAHNYKFNFSSSSIKKELKTFKFCGLDDFKNLLGIVCSSSSSTALELKFNKLEIKSQAILTKCSKEMNTLITCNSDVGAVDFKEQRDENGIVMCSKSAKIDACALFGKCGFEVKSTGSVCMYFLFIIIL